MAASTPQFVITKGSSRLGRTSISAALTFGALGAFALPGCTARRDPLADALDSSFVFSYEEATEVVGAPTPFEDRLEQIVGVDFDSVEKEMWSRRANAVAACASQRGITMTQAQIANIIPPTGNETREHLTSSELLKNTELYEAATDSAMQKVLFDCQDAQDTVSDPLAAFRAWQEQIQRDLYAKVESTDSYQHARRAEDDCFEQRGLDPTNPEADRSAVVSKAYDINQRWIAGEISKDERNDQLHALVGAERSASGIIDECATPRLAVEAAIIIKFQDAFLEQNRSALDDIGSDIRDQLAAGGYPTVS